MTPQLQLSQQLHAFLPLLRANLWQQDLTLCVRRSHLRLVSLFLRNHFLYQLSTLVDIVVIDRPRERQRFTVHYVFLSTRCNHRLILSLSATETTLLPSLSSAELRPGKRVFAAAGWMEREVWDLYGLFFVQHSDLRRILTDYGFSEHPFQKNFPLTGRKELVYHDNYGRIVHETVELAQEYRVFDTASTWAN